MAKQTPKPNKKNKKDKGFNLYWIYGLIALVLVFLLFQSSISKGEKISQHRFMQEILPTNDVERVRIVNNVLAQVFLYKDSIDDANQDKDLIKESITSRNAPQYTFSINSGEEFSKALNRKYNADPKIKQIEVFYHRERDWSSLISIFLPIAIIILFWVFMMRKAGSMGGPGGQIFNIGKSQAKMFDNGKQTEVTFDDVAGLDEAKVEVIEIVDFLKNPKKYTALGGKIPKGVLLVGPPGTGKTLLAKAMAGEAKVPFFSISGSDFVEMFVGVGASRVRDLFKQAREKAPCVIFIDEIDAIGRARGKQMMQSNDERENTLNQLLVEMDGFGGEKGIIMLAATNRPDVLDSALLRPGRFDRQISIDRPDLKGREQIFTVHLKPLKIDADISAHKLAAQTPGFAGADIANICNEAALIAARKNKLAVDMDDFNDAIDRSIGGLEKKGKIILPEEKRIIAYHEAGHAICGWFLEHAHPLVKVSIVPRGVAALGYAQYLPKEKHLQIEEEMLDGMCMTLGGRVAEDIIFGRISTGAQNDLDKVTQTAYAMITIYGMNDQIGNISFYEMMNENSFHKPYSEQTGKLIDDQARIIIQEQYERAKKLLLSKKQELEILANALLEKEVLFKEDLEKLFGPRGNQKKEASSDKDA